MSEVEDRFTPDVKRELSQEARALIALFQTAKSTADKAEQAAILREFVDRLNGLVDPGKFAWHADEGLASIIIEGQDQSPIPISTGTNGQRIYFMKHHPRDWDIKSPDGKVKWMCYPPPPRNDRYGGEVFYKRFLDNFGDEVVDMLQNLQ